MEFRQLEPRPQRPQPDPPYDRWLTEDGETTAEFYRGPGGFIVRFIDFADFALATGDWSVTCTPVPGAGSKDMRDLFQNQMVPLILGYRGDLVLHASGVAANGGVLAFAGPTGRGKSTLAASFARKGYRFLTDDGLILDRKGEQYLVRPNVPHFRLRDDSEAAIFGREAEGDDTGKRRIAASHALPFQKTPAPLRAIYLLGDGAASAVEIVELKPSAALSMLIAHSFMLDVDDRPRVRGHFDRLAELACSVPCFTLDFPRDYGYLPETMAAILDHAGLGDLAP